MKCVVAKFILRLLLPEQKEHRAAVAQTSTSEPDFSGDRSWVYRCYPETKARLSQWKSPGSPCLKKAWQSCSNLKTMLLTVFFDWEGAVYHK